MQIGGTLVNAVVKVTVLAATLALVYFFILKPILDTSETVSTGINGNIEKTVKDINQAFDQSNGQGESLTEIKIKRQVKTLGGRRQKRLINCIQNSSQDIGRIQRCADRFGS